MSTKWRGHTNWLTYVAVVLMACAASACYVKPANLTACDDPSCVDPDALLDTCGDGVVDVERGEACDEGDANSSEPNATCRPTCLFAGCGDGVLDEGEACDDGNSLAGDGCGGTCAAETIHWRQLVPSTSPSGRYGHAAVYDANNRQTVLFGGWTPNIRLADTWVFDGREWTQTTPATSPVARMSHAMAFDERRGVVVLFGGEGASGALLGDTWEFDGSNWTQRTLPVSPSARQGHAMAYDRLRQVVVLAGADTWEYDGVEWIARQPASSPPWRHQFAMTFDENTETSVIFGGHNGQYSTHFDTWDWNGTNWTERPTTGYPSPGWYGSLAFYGLLGRPVLVGGLTSGTGIVNTQVLDGTAWQSLEFSEAPSMRYGTPLVCDDAHGTCVLFGGKQYNGGEFQDTWLLAYGDANSAAEACDGSSDADGDGRLGCDDDDCWEACDPTCSPFLAADATCAADRPRCGDGTCAALLETAALCPADCS